MGILREFVQPPTSPGTHRSASGRPTINVSVLPYQKKKAARRGLENRLKTCHFFAGAPFVAAGAGAGGAAAAICAAGTCLPFAFMSAK